ncbi:MAG: tripartite tricarboxylate transporter TctB family protein [Proteobacteria bacterium]|nr:tripartite tricarboxylate transporter TctB family protein [Pseudomonadota bacterium]
MTVPPSARRAAAAAVPGLLPLLLGLFGLGFGLRYGVWDGAGPGAGLFPAASGGAMAALGLLILVTETSMPAPAAEGATRPWRLLGYVAGLLAFALLMEQLGAIAAIVLLFLWLLAVVERLPWRLVLAVTAGSAFSTWLLFERLLQVQLPRGFFG